MVEQRELILREGGPTIGVAHRRRRRSCVALIHTDHAVAIAQRGTRIPWHAIPEVVGGAHPAGSDEQYRETVAFDLVVEPDRSAFEHRHGQLSTRRWSIMRYDANNRGQSRASSLPAAASPGAPLANSRLALPSA